MPRLFLVRYLTSYCFLRARAGGVLRILQSDWLRERAIFSDLARGQWNPGVMSLLCCRGCESLSKKPINATKIGELPKYTNSYQWIKYDSISFVVGRVLFEIFDSKAKHR